MSKNPFHWISTLSRSVLAGSDRRDRPSRLINLRDMTLESRYLPAPVFYLSPTLKSGTNTVTSISQVTPAPGAPNPAPALVQQTFSGPAGGSPSTQNQNYVDYSQQQGSGGPPITNEATVKEAGISGNTDAVPTTTSGGSISEVQINVSHQHTDVVQTDTNGPYSINGENMGVQQNSQADGGKFNMVVENSNGTAAPPGSTVTISYSVQFTPPSSGRFSSIPAFHVASSYVTIATVANGSGGPEGIVVSNTSTGAILESNSTFDDGQPNATYGLQYSGIFPVITSTYLTYNDDLVSFPTGIFGPGGKSEFAADQSALVYDFSMTLNGPPHSKVVTNSLRLGQNSQDASEIIPPVQNSSPLTSSIAPVVSAITPDGPAWGHRWTPAGSVLQTLVKTSDKSGDF